MEQKPHDTLSLAHTSWKCQYHIVFAPKWGYYVSTGRNEGTVGILRKDDGRNEETRRVEMIKIVKQLDAGKYTVLCLDSPIPATRCRFAFIDGESFPTEIVYDLPNAIGIVGHGDFAGKEVTFG